MPAHSYAHRPLAAATTSYSPRQVALAYDYPLAEFDGSGTTVGLVELGGAYYPADLALFCKRNALAVPDVQVVLVDGATQVPDPEGADGEVALDVQVVAGVAPGAKIRVYFAPNTDDGFLHAIQQAAKECQVVSISWGGPENSWTAASLNSFDATFAAAQAAGVVVTAAAGDSGSDDGTGKPVADFPASSPHVVGCGGTRLTLDAHGVRAAEVVWDDNSTSSATGGGVSVHFPGRDVPDVAGNADPDTGYAVVIAGQWQVIGGTSAVAPLYAALSALLLQAQGKTVDLLTFVPANPTVCFDVTSGNNGAFRAGPGRDEDTGWGVVDAERALALLGGTVPPTPPPVPPVPPTPPVPPVPPAPQPTDSSYQLWLKTVQPVFAKWEKGMWNDRHKLDAAIKAWRASVE